MNVCFVMKEEYKDLESEFIEFASSQGMVGIKGTPFGRWIQSFHL